MGDRGVMNVNNTIQKSTKLFGYIGEHAGLSHFSAELNRLFRHNEVDAMMIPMNIRHDDLYFTLANMKHSQLSGVVVSHEYQEALFELYDEVALDVQKSGICELLFVKDKKVSAHNFMMHVLCEELRDEGAKRVALLGTTPHAKSFVLACGAFAPDLEIVFFDPNLESLMLFCQELGVASPDLNRIASDMRVDLSGFDALIDLSDLNSLEMVERLSKKNYDMRAPKEFSPLRERAIVLACGYVGAEDMSAKLVQSVYEIIKGECS